MNLAGMMLQTATYWARATKNEFAEFSYQAPVQIACRWQDQGTQFRNEQGELQLSKATIYSTDQVALGGYVFEGTSAASDPRTVTGAHEVKAVVSSRSLDGSEALYKVLV